MFVTDQIISEVADGMLNNFEGGTLHSRSSIREIASHAKEELADRGLPTRKSLCFVVAKVALMAWQEEIHATKQRLA